MMSVQQAESDGQVARGDAGTGSSMADQRCAVQEPKLVLSPEETTAFQHRLVVAVLYFATA